MKANELRVGNLVQDQFGKTEEIWAIDKYKVQLCSGAMYVKDIKDLRGIHLTEEWLLKFGVKKDFNSYWCIPNKYFELMYNKVIGYRLSIEGQYAYNEIKYVHQLQTLYFALTGQELEIKP